MELPKQKSIKFKILYENIDLEKIITVTEKVSKLFNNHIIFDEPENYHPKEEPIEIYGQQRYGVSRLVKELLNDSLFFTDLDFYTDADVLGFPTEKAGHADRERRIAIISTKGPKGNEYNTKEISIICAHEIGHILGLTHCYPSCIMNDSFDPSLRPPANSFCPKCMALIAKGER
jgi:hypothetical protein